MAKCEFCDWQGAAKERLKHQWDKHTVQMEDRRRKGTQHSAIRKKESKPPTETKAKLPTTTLNPIQAVLLKFVSQSVIVPMTPKLIFGFMCAQKYNGGELTFGDFLDGLVDDVFAVRGINYMQEVMEWAGPTDSQKETQEKLEQTPAQHSTG